MDRDVALRAQLSRFLTTTPARNAAFRKAIAVR